MPTIDEAIRVNTVLQGAPVLRDDQRVVDALKLDIEALRRVKSLRLTGKPDRYSILPGETEE